MNKFGKGVAVLALGATALTIAAPAQAHERWGRGRRAIRAGSAIEWTQLRNAGAKHRGRGSGTGQRNFERHTS